MAPTGFLLCGFSFPQVFFTVAFSGYVSDMEFLFFFFFPLIPQTFQKHFIRFLHPEERHFHNRMGPAAPVPLSQCDQNIHLHLARITTRDLDNIFALNKTANAILGVRQRHNKDKPCL